jgi:predicted dehydrogenase
MTEQMRVAVVGCGFFAQNHLHSWKDLRGQGVDLVAVCDIDSTKAKAAAETFGVPRWYSDVDTMFREQRLGLVDIVTRVDTHQRLVERAIANHVPTIVQKPFGPDLASCVAMAAVAKAKGVFLAVHENFRFQVPMRRVTDLLRSGVRLYELKRSAQQYAPKGQRGAGSERVRTVLRQGEEGIRCAATDGCGDEGKRAT